MWVCGMALCLGLLQPQSVYAGEMNAEEQRVLQAAGQVFTYQGESYQAAPEYLLKLRNYLMQDDVNMTSADADAAIQEGYANVERGVLEGYLLPLESKQPAEEVKPTTPTAPAETEEQQPEEPGKPTEPAAPEQPEKVTDPAKPAETERPLEQKPSGGQSKEEEGTTPKDTQPTEPDDTGGQTENDTEKTEDGHVTEAVEDLTEGIIKNTGYTLAGYIWTAGLILFGTAILLAVVYRFDYLHGREDRT